LSAQDVPINDSSSWVGRGAEDSEEEEDEEDHHHHSVLDGDGGLNGESRGRTQEAAALA
jgi:hypothetical protein